MVSGTCNGCLSAKPAPSARTPPQHGDTVLGRRPAPGQHAQGYSHHFHHQRSLFQTRAGINLLSVSYRQSADLQDSSQRDVMGVTMFNGGIQSTLTGHGRLFRASQPNQGSELWWLWGTAVTAIRAISAYSFSICSKVIFQENHFFPSCPEICARPRFDIPLKQNGAEGRNGLGSCYISLHHSLELLKVASVPRKLFPLLQL